MSRGWMDNRRRSSARVEYGGSNIIEFRDWTKVLAFRSWFRYGMKEPGIVKVSDETDTPFNKLSESGSISLTLLISKCAGLFMISLTSR